MLEQISVLEAPAPVVAPAKTAVDVASVLNHYTYTMPKKEYALFKHQPLFVIAQYFGFDFKKDRKALAEHFMIKNYVGTSAQNIQIKQVLLKLVEVK